MRVGVLLLWMVVLCADAGAQSLVPLPNLPGREIRAGALLGRQLPDFLLPTVGGQTLQLSSLRGRPVVICFWAFWCDTWREVHRGLLDVEAAVPRCERVTVSIDCQWTEQLRTLARTPYHMLLDPGSALSRQLGVRAVPTVVLVDGFGKVRAVFEGWPGTRKMVARVRALEAHGAAR